MTNKKIRFSLILFLITVIGFAQEDETSINEQDAFTYEEINVVDQEEGNLSISGNDDTKQKSNEAFIESVGKNSGSGIGETPGNLSVSLTGGANYEVPIAVPPGIDGIVPKIFLSYNSQGGNGLAGYGWNVNGISVISRIPASKYHDGEMDGVDFDNLDRFALDGERLILKSGTYGANGAQYETEKYSNLKITSHGTSPYGASYGPSYFIIHYPDGSIARYGNSTDSRSHTNYAIANWESPQGVRIGYEYVKNYNSQSISKIKYGSLGTNSPINEIRFSYGTRKRWEQSYIDNVSIVRKDILKGIESYSNGIRYRAYSLSHTSDSETKLKYERLRSIREISGDGSESHTAIFFSYATSSSSVNYNGITTNLGLTNIEQRNAQVASLDMTGNGKMDFIAYPNTKNKFWLFHDIQSSENNHAYEVDTGNFESIFPSNLLNNQNKVLSGQGLTIVQKGTGNQVKFKVYSKVPPSVGLPIGYDYTKTWNAPPPTNGSIPDEIPKEYVSGDFNGDGLTDVLAIGKPYQYEYCPPPSGKGLEDASRMVQRKVDDDDHDCELKTYNYKNAYFIDLRRDVASSFTNYAGALQLQLSGAYKLQTGDFNGDGKTDLLHITNGKLYVYSLDDDNHLSLLWQVTDPGITTTAPPMLGDYNGDGKTDFLDPVANESYSFRMFISTGTAFVEETRTMPFKYVKTNWNGVNGVFSGYNLVPLDVNGDGKTDIVEYRTVTKNNSSNGTQTIKIYNNLGLYGTTSATRTRFVYGGTASKTGNLEHYPIPVFLTSNQPNKNLDFASISNKWVTNFSFTQDHREDVLLKSVTNNGVRYDIGYSNLDPSIYHDDYNARVYQSAHDQTYPNVDLEIAPGTKVVTRLERRGRESSWGFETIKKTYTYRGAVFNAEGLGFLGFQAIATSNWHTDSSDRIFSVSKYDPGLRGAMTEEYAMANYFSFTTPTSDYISKTTYQYSSSLSASKVFKLWLDSSLNQNNLEGTYANTTYPEYDPYNNPKVISTSFMGGSRTQNISYSNSTGSNYHIGRPINMTSSTTIGSETFSTEQQLVYSGHLVHQRKIKGNGTPFDVETYDYDAFGNIIKKTTTPNGESSRDIEFEYDPSGRYIEKFIDVEGLETTYLYDIASGNLEKEINPFGQETTYEYDAWDRQIKTIDYLGKEASIDYVETNTGVDDRYKYTVTSSADDGTGTMAFYDQLHRLTEIKEKNAFGEWIGKKYEYDALDRLLKESEPYTGDNPSQWNETAYDLYGRPTSQTLYTGRVMSMTYNGLTTTVNDGVKTVTSTRNQLGNITSVTDPGGTINYQYYGNGNLKTSNYDGVVVSIEQDGWGRKRKLTDPSAGVYEYTYNGFGEITNETSPKGSTEYVYSPLGKLKEEHISGDHVDMSIEYTYDPTHKLLNTISMTSTDGNDSSYGYGYDSHMRLSTVSESNPYAEFNIQYEYDDFGRIETEEYHAKLLSNNKTSTKKIKNAYQNGVLKAIKDFGTNNNIWNATSVNARGQLTSASIGNDIVDSRTYDNYGYLSNANIAKNTGASSQTLMQLATDFNAQRGVLNSRSNSMFSWSETFEYDDLDRLITFNDNNGDNNMTYDDSGRITYNNTVGDYNYEGSSYKVSNVNLNDQGDLHYQQNRLEQVRYNAFKKPFEINEQGKERIGFQYNAFMGRSHMFHGDEEEDILERNNRKHYSHDGSMEIGYDEDAGTTLFVTYMGGDAYGAPAIWRSEQGEVDTTDEDYYYLHRDYLGSILLITDGDGNAQEKRHFDAWGKAVKITDGNDMPLDKLTFLDRGYTGHEHLQGVGLIHMNGRLYDPNLKRFLSPDNHIQDIANTQNFNRYGYVLNNPLLYVDPSGETYNGTETGGMSTGELGLGALAGSALSWLSSNWGGIDNWTTKNIFKPIQKMQPGKWIAGWFKKRSKDRPPVEYENYDNLSSDPLAGSTVNTPNSFFGGGGTENGGLGITAGDVADTVTDFIPIVGSAKDIYQGFRDGNWWQAAAGIGGLVLDVATLGSASLVKGAIKTGIKQGTKAISRNIAKRAFKNCLCFEKETLVHTENGLVEIKDIKEGDRVWAFNENTSEKELKKVIATFEKEKDTLYVLQIGETQIKSTGEHPYFVKGDWVDAKDLRVGDVLTLVDGSKVRLEKISVEPNTSKVYDFEVEGLHNYYVSNIGVLVHNNCATKLMRTVTESPTLGKTIEKAYGKKALNYFENNLKTQLSNGSIGGNIHDLGKQLAGYKAIDLPGTGKGRGAGRIVFKELSNGVIEILGLVKGHNYKNILN